MIELACKISKDHVIPAIEKDVTQQIKDYSDYISNATFEDEVSEEVQKLMKEGRRGNHSSTKGKYR
jgi:hypothetical protein